MTLACPRCGLRLSPGDRVQAVEHCPRCLSIRRRTVKMISASGADSPRPSTGLVASFARQLARDARTVRA